MNSLIGARLLQGIGAAGRQSVGVIIVLDLTTPDTRGLWLGFFNLASATGLAIGPVLGAIISVDTDWRWLFWITLMLIGLTLVIGSISLRYPVPHREQRVGLLAQLREVDYVGCVLAVAISSMICAAIEMGNKMFPWNVSLSGPSVGRSSILSPVRTYNFSIRHRGVSHPCVRLLRTQSGRASRCRHQPIQDTKHSDRLSHQFSHRRGIFWVCLLPSSLLHRRKRVQPGDVRDPNARINPDSRRVVGPRRQHRIANWPCTTGRRRRRSVIRVRQRLDARRGTLHASRPYHRILHIHRYCIRTSLPTLALGWTHVSAATSDRGYQRVPVVPPNAGRNVRDGTSHRRIRDQFHTIAKRTTPRFARKPGPGPCGRPRYVSPVRKSNTRCARQGLSPRHDPRHLLRRHIRHCSGHASKRRLCPSLETKTDSSATGL